MEGHTGRNPIICDVWPRAVPSDGTQSSYQEPLSHSVFWDSPHHNVAREYGPRPLKSTGRHGAFKALVTWDMGIKMIVTRDMDIS